MIASLSIRASWQVWCNNIEGPTNVPSRPATLCESEYGAPEGRNSKAQGAALGDKASKSIEAQRAVTRHAPIFQSRPVTEQLRPLADEARLKAEGGRATQDGNRSQRSEQRGKSGWRDLDVVVRCVFCRQVIAQLPGKTETCRRRRVERAAWLCVVHARPVTAGTDKATQDGNRSQRSERRGKSGRRDLGVVVRRIFHRQVHRKPREKRERVGGWCALITLRVTTDKRNTQMRRIRSRYRVQNKTLAARTGRDQGTYHLDTRIGVERTYMRLLMCTTSFAEEQKTEAGKFPQPKRLDAACGRDALPPDRANDAVRQATDDRTAEGASGDRDQPGGDWIRDLVVGTRRRARRRPLIAKRAGELVGSGKRAEQTASQHQQNHEFDAAKWVMGTAVRHESPTPRSLVPSTIHLPVPRRESHHELPALRFEERQRDRRLSGRSSRGEEMGTTRASMFHPGSRLPRSSIVRSVFKSRARQGAFCSLHELPIGGHHREFLSRKRLDECGFGRELGHQSSCGFRQ